MGLTWRSCIQGLLLPAICYLAITSREGYESTKISLFLRIHTSMIGTLITSKTRIKLLLKFFLNPGNSAYLRGLETEFGESSNAIRLELNRLEEANMLTSELTGNRKLFKVNQKHPLYKEINSIVRKYFGLDVVIENIANRLGNLKAVYLTGDISQGKDSGIIDMLLLGDVDQKYLLRLIEKAEKLIDRKIRYLVVNETEFEQYRSSSRDPLLLIWSSQQTTQKITN